MNVGSFCERLTLSYPTSSSIDSMGQVIQVFATSSCWAGIKYSSGNESDAKGVFSSKAKYVFTIRADANFTEKGLIAYRGANYNITFVQRTPEEKNRYMLITAERQT